LLTSYNTTRDRNVDPQISIAHRPDNVNSIPFHHLARGSIRHIMQHINASSLNFLPERVAYLKSFLDFNSNDVAALHAAKPVITPLIPVVLDAVYVKLLSFDITAIAFVPRNTDYEGETVDSVQELTLESPQIAFRKDFLKNYLVKLVTADYESKKTWEYLDQVGVMHTGMPGLKYREKLPGLRVEYIHIGMLLGAFAAAGHSRR
jgi:Protoglobin